MPDNDQNTPKVSGLNPYVDEDEINLLDYWRVLMKRKRLLALIIGTAAIASVIISLLLPKIYASTTSLLPPEDSAGGMGLLSSLPSGMSGLAGGLLGKGSPGDLWVGILESQTIRDEIISRFNLREFYQAGTIEGARSALNNVVKIKKSKEGIVFITVEDKEPERATQMARAFVEELDKVNKSIVMTSGGRMRTFIEGRLDEAKVLLASAEEALKSFQEQNRAVKLDAQSQAIIEAIGNVKGQLMAKEVELQTLLSFATSQNPQVEILKTQVKELKQGLQELEVGKGNTLASSKSIFIPTSKIPELSLKYVRLLREAKIQETLFELLTQQYEMARIQEAKDSPTVQVLDVAKVPEEKSKPKRALIVLLSTFTAGFFGIFLVFFLEYIEKASVEGGDKGREA
jgi:capsule polysaccharide export protein KpsE/RkpR